MVLSFLCCWQAHNLTAKVNYNKNVYLSGWRLAFGSQKVNSLRKCTVNVWIFMNRVKAMRNEKSDEKSDEKNYEQFSISLLWSKLSMVANVNSNGEKHNLGKLNIILTGRKKWSFIDILKLTYVFWKRITNVRKTCHIM